jgi:putative acetyltransferase
VDDGPAVQALVGQVLAGFGLQLDAETDADLADPVASYEGNGGWFAVLDDDGKVVGSVGVMRRDDSTCELRKMYLLPDLQGLGLGRLLLESALERARLLGFREMILETNSCLSAARRLYESYGFEPCALDHLSPRCDIALRREL